MEMEKERRNPIDLCNSPTVGSLLMIFSDAILRSIFSGYIHCHSLNYAVLDIMRIT